MGKLKVMPIRGNREKALTNLILFTSSEYILAHRRERLIKEKATLLSIDLQDHTRARLAASTIGGYMLADAVDHLIANDINGWQEMTEALSVGFLGAELKNCPRVMDPRLYCSSDSDDLYYIAFHATLAGLGLWNESDCLCNHLLNLWRGRGIDVGLDNQEDFLGFYWALMRAQHKRRWPELSDLDRDEFGEFFPLFQSVGSGKVFSEALEEYCDFRLARMHEYPSQHATRRYPEIHTDALTYEPLLLFPAELLAFKAVFERITGETCDLSGNHALLNLPVMQPPSNLTLTENPYTERINAVGENSFGARWQPGNLVEVLFEEPPTLLG